MAQGSCAVHFRHAQVGYNDIEAASITGPQSAFAAEGKLHVPALSIRMQQTPDSIEKIAFIIHKQDAFHAATPLVLRASPA